MATLGCAIADFPGKLLGIGATGMQALADYLKISIIIGAIGLLGLSIVFSVASVHWPLHKAGEATFLFSGVVLCGWLAFLGLGLYDEGEGVLRFFLPCLPVILIGACGGLVYVCSYLNPCT
jgi:hypothetical protein